MSENAEVGIEKIQQLNQLLEETLESRSKGQLIQLVRLLGSSLGAIRVGQSDQQKQDEARDRMALTQAIAAGDPDALEQTRQATIAAITEILTALNALQEPQPDEGGEQASQ
ncbi:hypothetical protein MIB92_01550 [Aestuariirhabdus sp. Z084]|uniref:hypothetical protein n=1 Tax=Aestuariirhabdus haliotis TaxID=2918751 RepID=UPI00201B45FF|nr:hypothetical protein [Aestuariirhabdus haliotis]MCL6414323.1 hypothetical protein [Aestuariirhabdus haliotis]MCL6418255.1 hypothetical protein [Aestuariirhabdus haliotis]